MKKHIINRRLSVRNSHCKGVLAKEKLARMQTGANRCRSGYVHRPIVREEAAVLKHDGAFAKQDVAGEKRGAAITKQDVLVVSQGVVVSVHSAAVSKDGVVVQKQDGLAVKEDGAVALEFALLLPSLTLLLTIGILLGSTVLASIQSQALAYNAVTLLTTNQTTKAGLSAKLPTLNKATVTVSPSFPRPGDFVTVTVERDLFAGISFMPVVTLEHKASAIQQVNAKPYE